MINLSLMQEAQEENKKEQASGNSAKKELFEEGNYALQIVGVETKNYKETDFDNVYKPPHMKLEITFEFMDGAYKGSTISKKLDIQDLSEDQDESFKDNLKKSYKALVNLLDFFNISGEAFNNNETCLIGNKLKADIKHFTNGSGTYPYISMYDFKAIETANQQNSGASSNVNLDDEIPF